MNGVNVDEIKVGVGALAIFYGLFMLECGIWGLWRWFRGGDTVQITRVVEVKDNAKRL
ncbi:MAG TPA: hypothetical protein PKH75_13535 [Bacillota bacterium]|nr:hypothetical protein [Bacillota bacterium]